MTQPDTMAGKAARTKVARATDTTTRNATDRDTGGERPRSRELPAIDPEFAVLDHEGYGWRRWMIRLPQGAIADDLKEPGIWSKVQKQRSALRRHDHLYIVAYDESWAAEAVVTDASVQDVHLSKPRIIVFERRAERLFEDDLYRVRWYGNGYGVERKADGRRISDIVASAALAERDLVRLYPRAG